ncbi:MAG: hydroxypyruvate isomerase [Thermoleophilia bacterium]
MPKFSANLSMLFGELPFLDRFAAAAEAGFTAVEYLFPYSYEKEELAARLREHGLSQVLHNLPAGDWDSGERGIACLPDRIEEFREGVERALEYSTALDCPRVNCLAGVVPPDLSVEKAEHTLVGNLQYAAQKLAEAGKSLLVEALNTRDVPGFLVNGTEQTVRILDRVGASNVYVQYDVYHMQRMEGDLTRTLEGNLSRIGHIQIADNPGRHEPGTGEINYDFLFGALDRMGYDGWIGCEYVPARSTAEGLDWLKPYLR